MDSVLDAVTDVLNWLMSRSFPEYIAIVIAVALVIWELGRLIAAYLKHRRNGGNGDDDGR
ncbi:MAG: hypothetical protein J2P21_30625 [Chloracidobacterium sp.]|nr:hypothetical protein [Chloracidobacterium sp.]